MEFRSFGHSLSVMPSSVVRTVWRVLEDNVNVTGVVYEAAGYLDNMYSYDTLPYWVIAELHKNFHKSFSTIKAEISVDNDLNKKAKGRYPHPFMFIRYTLTNSPNLV